MRLYNPRLVYLYQALMLLILSVGLAWTINEVRPDSLSWLDTGPEPATMADGFEATPELDVTEAMRLHEQGLAVFVDARHEADYADGHIPGAVSVPLGLFEDEIEAKLAPYGRDAKYVVYCSSITCGMAQEMALALGFMEYPDVSVFAGGMEGWAEAGGEIESLIQGGEATLPELEGQGMLPEAAEAVQEMTGIESGETAPEAVSGAPEASDEAQAQDAAQAAPEADGTQGTIDANGAQPESGEVAQ